MKVFRKMLAITLLTVMAVTLAPIASLLNPTEVHAETNYLTFTALVDNSSVTLGYDTGTNIQYRKNNGTWMNYTEDTKISLNKDESVSFKGDGIATASHTGHFSMSGKIAASGDVTSLTNGVGGDATLTESCYSNMFLNCTALTSAPALPSTTLAENCYANMFSGCTALETAPVLPATTLANRCYTSMFSGCTALTSAPALSATTLADYCYSSMFTGCTALTSAPALSATNLATGCYMNMFQNCSALKVAPALSATTLADGCYRYMFSGCTSLKAAPVLPATKLAYLCYSYMFSGCTALIAPAMMNEVTTLAKECCKGMYGSDGQLYKEGCTALKIYASSQSDSDYTKAWKAANTTTAAENWAQDMFKGCGASVDVTAGSTYYIAKYLTVGEQTGSLTYGTAASATYDVTLVEVSEPSDFTVTWYDNNNQSIDTPAGVTASYNAETDKFTVNTTASTPAGTYQFTLKTDDVTSKKAALTVAAKDISGCTVDDIANQTYNGNALEPAVSVKDGNTTLQKGTDYTLSYKDSDQNSVEAASLKNAGIYTVTVTGTGNYQGSVDKTFTIDKSKELKIVVCDEYNNPTDIEFGTRTYSFTYDGTAHKTNKLKVNKLSGTVDYQYSTDGGKTWTTYSVSTSWSWGDTDVTNDAVIIKVEDQNYETATCAITFTIKQKQLSITGTTATDKAYDGTTNATVTKGEISGVVTGDDVTVTATGAFTDKNAGKDKDVTVTYSLSGTKSANYIAPASETLKASISSRSLSVMNTRADGKTYDGNTDAVIGILGTLTGAVSGDDVSIDEDNTVATFENKDAGNGKTVTVSYTLKGADKDNYTVQSGETTADIEKKEITITPDANQSKVYKYEDPTLTYTNSDAIEGETVKISGTLSRETGEDVTVNGYKITLGTLVLEDNEDFKAKNYKLVLDEEAVYFMIRKDKIALPEAIEDLHYNGEEQNGIFLLVGTPYTVTNNMGKDAGTYSATASLNDKNNYEWDLETPTSEDQSIEYSIAKRSVILTSASAAKIYDEEPLTNDEITVGGDGFVEGEGAEYEVTGSQSEIGKSLNTFSYSLNSNTKASNYDIETEFGTLYVLGTNGKKSENVKINGSKLSSSFVIGNIQDIVIDVKDNNSDPISSCKAELYDQKGKKKLTDCICEEGSIKVIIPASFIRTLSAGTHDFIVKVTNASGLTYSYELTIDLTYPPYQPVRTSVN